MAARGALGRVTVLIGKAPVDGFVAPFLPDGSPARIGGAVITSDTRTYSPREIRGWVTEVGAAVVCTKLTLIPHDNGSDEQPRSTWSGTSGIYVFRNLRPGRYVVTAFHLGGEFRAKSIHVDTEL